MRIVAYIAFGIILPALALLIEATGAPLASEVFDPIPTTGHMALVALVVLANLLAPMGHPTCDPRLRHLIAWLNGVALVYALVFLPLALPGVMLIPFMGIGFLVLSPMFALVCAAAVRVWLQQQAPAGQRLPWLWPWVAVGALLLVALELPGTLTRLGIETATTGSPAASARAVGLLRDWAPRQEMLRLCYENGRQMNVTWWMCPARPLPIAVARSVLFRVTGKPLSAFGSPRRNTRFPWASVNGDTNQGGTEVGQRVAGLALIASHMEGMHHGDAGMGYLEWTLEFENASAAQAEAWAEVDLPPGAVVSRLTLWIDDRPKEATFAGSAKVRAAYEAVVRQQRDPVLVTASGPDRVLVQCFPVPPNGGTIHVRLGITAPLDINQPGKAALRLPRFAERNFDIPEGDIHNLNIGGKSVIASVDGLKPITDGQQSNAVVGRVSDMALASPVGVRLTSAGPARRVWAATGPGQAVVQTVDREKVAPIRRLVVVADGSVGMRNHLADIAEAIDRVSSEVDIQVLFAGDQVDESVEALRAGRAVGGRDNVPALLRACELAAEVKPAVVVWIHAAQPVLLRSPDSLHALFDRWPDGVRFYDVPTTPGPNAILQGRAAAPILPLSRRGSLADDLSRFFGEITTGDSMRIQREQTPREVAAKGEAREVSERLEKLFAYETVLRLCRSGQQENREAAVKLATQAKLVTPVTGAVVLETKEQYDRAGLEQADDPQAGSPSMGFAKSSHGPEPTWFVLLAVVAGAAGFAKWNRRRAGRC